MAKKKTTAKPAAARSLALARRKSAPQAPTTTALTPQLVTDAIAPLAARSVMPSLNNEVNLDMLGFDPPSLTKEQEAILARPVDPARVLIKPTGQPYLSHPDYTRWLNDAFGRLQWAMRPISLPIKTVIPGRPKTLRNGTEIAGKDRNVVQQAFLLYVKGKPVAAAWGEQEFHEDNAEQTHGDAVEACVASALRRVMKRMGVGLELWDRRWLDAWIRAHAVRVKVAWSNRPMWRLADGPMLDQEVGPWTDAPPPRSQGSGPGQQRGYRSSTDTREISEAQLGRLIAIAKRHSVTDAALKQYLGQSYPYTIVNPQVGVSKKKIQRKDYDAVCQWVESVNTLPEEVEPDGADFDIDADDIPWSGGREPGAEG